MTFSIIVCTHNRCESLRKTVESILRQHYNGTAEIIIVDNASGDATKDVVFDLQSKSTGIFNIRYIYESQLGLSYARNTGVSAAKGEIIVFTDDDCIVDEKWIAVIDDSFCKYDATCIFGKVIPLWLAEKPLWLTPDFYPKLALLDYGDEAFEVTSKKRSFYGANFAVKKEMFDVCGMFDTELGRKGDVLYVGEEEKLFQQMLSRGEKVVYEPRSFVNHQIPPQRMTKKYFRKYCFDAYRTGVRSEFAEETGIVYFYVPRYLYRECIVKFFVFLKSLLLFRQDTFVKELACWATAGEIYEYFLLNRKKAHE